MNRIDYIDISKGITIILMVLGHTSLPSFIQNWIFSFHMPFFFIVSGICTDFLRGGVKEFLYKRLISIIVPFFLYSFIVALTLQVNGFRNIIDILTNGWEGYALWFIPVYFLASMLAYLISNISNRVNNYIFLFGILFIGVLCDYLVIKLPWSLTTVPAATFFILLGHRLKNYICYIVSPSKYLILILIFLSIMVSQFWKLDMAWNNITPIFPIVLGAISGSALILIISYFLVKKNLLLAKILTYIGKNTYIVLAFSQIIIMLLNKYFSLNVIIKYSMLVLILILISYINNRFFSIIKIKK